ADAPGLKELSGKRAKVRKAMGEVRRTLADPQTDSGKKATLQAGLGSLTNQLAQLDVEVNQLASKSGAKKALLDREKILGQLAANRKKQEPFDTAIKAKGNTLQLWQEMGGLAGRIALAVLLVVALSKRALLRLFQVPGLLIVPVTYFYLFRHEPGLFPWG